MSEPPSAPGQSREVRVSVYAERVLRRWYVVVGTVVVAIAIGFLHGHGSSARSDATATVYMGQPVTPVGSSLFQGSPWTSGTAVNKVVTSDQAIAAAAKAAGVAPTSIPGHITTHLLASSTTTSTGAKSTSSATYYSVEAEGPWSAAKAGIIANVLADRLRDSANGYANAKAATLRSQIADEQTTIKTLTAANALAQRQITRLSHSTSPGDVALLAALISQMSNNTTTMATAQAALGDNQLQLASVNDLEAASVTAPAGGHLVSATSRRNSLVVSALLGLILGVGLALIWDAVAERPRAVAAG